MAAMGLGVQCDFCHNTAAYDSDEKRQKVVARAMFGMVKDINSKFPDGKAHVTCYTCHRGLTSEPAMAPPPAAEGDGGARVTARRSRRWSAPSAGIALAKDSQIPIVTVSAVRFCFWSVKLASE